MANPNVEGLEGTMGIDQQVVIKVDAEGAPDVQEMIDTLNSWENGAAIRQTTQLGEALINAFTSLPFEQRNKYKISGLGDKHTISKPCDSDGWKPSAAEMEQLPAEVMALEDSTLGMRLLLNCLGCGNLRPLTMRFMSGSTGVQGLEAQRPFNLGGFCCCPHQTNVNMGNEFLGRVEEDWYCYNWPVRCFQASCCCLTYHNVLVPGGQDGKLMKKFRIPVGLCCAGGHCNACGATCLNNDMVFDIYEYEQNTSILKPEPVGRIQKTFAGGDCCSPEAWGRMCFQFDNFLVEFPEKADYRDKATLLASVFQIEYVLFERKGNDN